MFQLFRYAVFFSACYSLFRYQKLWRLTKLPLFIYWVLQIGLLSNYFFMGFRSGVYPTEMLTNVMSIVSAICFMYFLYAGYMCLIMDIIVLLGKRKNGRLIRCFRRAERNMLVILFITVIFAIAGIIGMRTNRFVNYGIAVKKASSVEQLRIAMISDAHMGTGVTRAGLSKIVDKINSENVDIVFIVGDFFDNATTEALKEHTTKEMARLKVKYGAFYVEGNHELHLEGDPSMYFRRAGVKVLQDEAVTIAGNITIVGRKDFRNDPVATSELMRNISKENPVILLTHRPKEFEESVEAGIDLQVSGHTHGGQFPFGSIGTSLENDMNYGIKQVGEFHAVTTSGIGGWSVPIKLFYPSEIVLITMKFL